MALRQRLKGYTFSTPTKPKFEWIDDIKDLKDEEIEKLIIHCRSVTASFEAEISHRSQPQTDSIVQSYSALLLSKANNINDSGLFMNQECQLILCYYLQQIRKQIHAMKLLLQDGSYGLSLPSLVGLMLFCYCTPWERIKCRDCLNISV